MVRLAMKSSFFAFFQSTRGPSRCVSFFMAIAGAAALSACNIALQFESGSAGNQETGGAGGVYEPGVGGSSSAGTGGLSGMPPSTEPYAYLCGGADAACIPGHNDCALGGDPGMGTAGMGANAVDCQLSEVDDAVVAACKGVGSFGEGSPCQSVDDCAAGLGCVATPSGGICRPYCCGDVETCPSSTYCAPTQMAESSLQIPVCVPAKSCKLLDDSSCSNGQICTVVRADGTTSCVDPGPGMLNESCPCAAGFFCFKVTNTCLKLCHIGNDAECDNGVCQGGMMNFPEGIGVCAGS